MNIKIKIICSIVLGVAFSIATFLFISRAEAHPGNTDAYGCHTCRTNCFSWGLSYGEYHCHTPKYYVPPTYIPPAYTYTPAQPWSCKINGITYYNDSEAKSKWSNMVHEAVDSVYRQLLERTTNQNDYNYWESKIPYNNCSFSVDSKVIWNEVLQSDEYKNLQAKKIAAKPADPPVETKSTEQPKKSWFSSFWDWLKGSFN